MENKNLFLSGTHGFCAGVENAINSFNELLYLIEKLSLKKEEENIWGYHDIVHNNYITKSFIDRGVIFTNNIECVPDGSWVVFSAHGVGQNIIDKAEEKNLKIIDLTCPLVSKVHKQILKFAKIGCEKILYIGNKDHQESKGTLNRILISGLDFETIYTLKDIENLNISELKNKKLAYLSQTTLNSEEVREIVLKLREIFPEILGGDFGEICHATKNRQMALKKIFEHAEKSEIIIDCLIVIGSETSSNSNKLAKLGQKYGLIPSYLVDDLSALKKKVLNVHLLKNIALTAGASAPKVLIDEIINYFIIDLNFKLQKIDFIEEDIVFHPPKIIRDLQKQVLF